MNRIIHAELRRLLRPRALIATALASVAFATIAATTVISGAKDVAKLTGRGGTTLAELAESGGGTQSFAFATSFVGFLVFVTFIALIATEFSGGTLRALLLRDPHRLRLIGGKLVATLMVAAAALLLAEAASFGLSLAIAPGRGIDTSAWFSIGGLGHALRDFGTVLAGVTGWAIFGTTLAVIFRSVPLALAVGFAWAGPFENILVDSWSTGYRVFLGQVLGAVIQGGNPEISLGRAALTGLAYVAIAAAATATLLRKRDITS
jgi:hypothetical protein